MTNAAMRRPQVREIAKLAAISAMIILSGCSTIPEKVPELLEVSAGRVDNQAARVVSEWEAAIAAANAAKKMLEIIEPYLSSIDTSTVSPSDKVKIERFLRGYPYVVRQLDGVLSQSGDTQASLRRIGEITDAIRLANTYISQVVDENARIAAVIEQVKSLSNEEGSGTDESRD